MAKKIKYSPKDEMVELAILARHADVERAEGGFVIIRKFYICLEENVYQELSKELGLDATGPYGK